MRVIKSVLLFGVGFILSLNFAHAQPAVDSAQAETASQILIPAMNPNGPVPPIAWAFNGITVNGNELKLDSVADLQTMLEAVQGEPPIPFASLPKNRFNQVTATGFWSLQNPNWPPLPGLIQGENVWPLGNGAFIIDDRLIDYDAIAKQAASNSITTRSMLSPSRLEDESGGITFGFSALVYSTNDLWLEITSVNLTNQLATLLVHNTQDTYFYQLLSKTNLLQSGWTLGQEIIYGASGTNQTAFNGESISGNPMMFFRAQQANWYVTISAGIDAVEPQASMPGQNGIFYLYRGAATGTTNDLTVFYRASGTASNGVDYTMLSGVITFTNSSSSAEIDVQPIADSLVEGTETVTLTLLPTNTYLFYSGYDSATVQIFDSSTTISIINLGDTVIYEPDGPPGVPATVGQFIMFRSDDRGIYTNNLTVKYLISGTASNGVDYTNLTGTMNFAPDITETNININPLKDNLPEGLETVTLTLYPTNAYRVDAANSNATVSISDSSTTLSISAGDNAVEPGPTTNFPGQTGFFTVSRSDTRGILTNLTVNYMMSGAASNGLDYSNLSGTVTFAPGNTSTNIYVQPIADALLEGNETVTLTLVATNGYLIDTNNAQGSITIQDTVFFYSVPIAADLLSAGIEYHAPSNSLIVSPGGGFTRIYTNLVVSNSVVMTNVVVTNWSRIAGLTDEVKLATPKTTVAGFTNGDLFFSSSTGVGWLSSDATRSNLNWCVLTNSTVTNGLPLRGGLYVDQSGMWSNNLIVVTSPGTASSGNKGVWRVNSNRQPTLIANINTPHLEGVITLTNDPAKWGPWAGKIITGDEDFNPNPVIYSIATNGQVVIYDTTTLIPGGIHPEDFDIIPPNQDLYACDEIHHSIAKLPKTYFASYVGDLLIVDEVANPSKLFIIHWNAATTNFTTISIPFKYEDGSLGEFEHVTFAPIDLPTQ